ncbi:hypothetical protein DAEQUDRAFT_767434 [Daedalea quercina L-15889]|uniref:Uncharacterized protein n=1 Tax=Daedalea quercina L-15889 TaxID=1314783 RepID=A0A165NPJ6_9APHY|nr:hypothetical protein DAEQUDRAFT_767434 [Daedalea quercina L-15889]
MWEALKKAFGTPDAAYSWSLFCSLIKSPEMSDSKPLQNQTNKIVTRLKEVIAGGIKLDESTQALILLSKVPETYQTMVSVLMATVKLTELKVETVINKILAEESLCCSVDGSLWSCGGKHGKENCWTKYPHLHPKAGGKGGKGKGKGTGKDKVLDSHQMLYK